MTCLLSAIDSTPVAPLLASAGATAWSADRSVLILSAGLLLIFLECNRPGWVIPGAAGVLLCLLALHSLSILPLRSSAVLLVSAALCVLALPLRLASGWTSLLAGSTFLTLGLARLSAQESWSLPAAACGLLLGPSTAWLTMLAGRARRAKRHPDPATVQTRRVSSPHGWE